MGSDYDITLTAGVELKDAKASMNSFAKTVQASLAKSVDGVDSIGKALNSVQTEIKKTSTELDKVVNDTKKDVDKLNDTKIGSELSKKAQSDIAEYQEKLKTTTKRAEELKAQMEAMGKTKTIVSPEWEKQSENVKALEQQYVKLEEKRADYIKTQKEMGKDMNDIKEMKGYKKIEADMTRMTEKFVEADDALKNLNKTVEIPVSGTAEYKALAEELKSVEQEAKLAKGAIERIKVNMAEDTLGKAVEPSKKIKSAIESLNKLEVKIGTKDFDRQAERVRQKIAEIELENKQLENMQVPTEKYSELEKRVESAGKKFDSLEKKAQDYIAVQQALGFDIVEIKGQTAFQKIQAAEEAASNTLIQYKTQLADIVASNEHMMAGKDTEQYKQNIEAVAQLQSRFNELQSQNDMAKSASATAQGLDAEGKSAESAGESIKSLADSKAKATKNNGELSDSASRTTAILSKAGNTLKKIFAGIGKGLLKGITAPFKKLRSNSKGVFGEMANNAKISFLKILKYAFGIRSIYALFRRLRNYTKEAFDAMASSVPQVRSELNSLKVSLTQARNSLATAFQPIFSYIVPALNALCSALVAAMNTLANFFATFTGQKFIYKATKANDALAKSIGGAGGAAKDAAEDIAEYDKLIIINKDKADGGGGGGGGADANAGAFEKSPAEPNAFAEMIKEAWKKSDFTEVGYYIGEKLKGALDGINWDGIKESARRIAKDVATLIDGFFSVPGLFASIGKTVGEGINTAIEGAYTFVNEMTIRGTWAKIGKQLGEGVNAFFTTTELRKLGQTIAGAINGAVTTVHEFIKTTDFKMIADSIADGINGFLKDIDTAEIARTIHDAIQSALDFFNTLLTETDFEEVGKKIGDFLANLDLLSFVDDIAKLIWNLIKAAFEALIGLFESAPLEASLIAAFAILKFTGLGSFVAGQIKSALVTSITTGTLGTSVGNALAGLFKVGGVIFVALTTAIIGWNIGKWIYDYFSDEIDAAVDWIHDKITVKDSPKLEGLKEKAQRLADNKDAIRDGLTLPLEQARNEARKLGLEGPEKLQYINDAIGGIDNAINGVLDTMGVTNEQTRRMMREQLEQILANQYGIEDIGGAFEYAGESASDYKGKVDKASKGAEKSITKSGKKIEGNMKSVNDTYVEQTNNMDKETEKTSEKMGKDFEKTFKGVALGGTALGTNMRGTFNGIKSNAVSNSALIASQFTQTFGNIKTDSNNASIQLSSNFSSAFSNIQRSSNTTRGTIVSDFTTEQQEAGTKSSKIESLFQGAYNAVNTYSNNSKNNTVSNYLTMQNEASNKSSNIKTYFSNSASNITTAFSNMKNSVVGYFGSGNSNMQGAASTSANNIRDAFAKSGTGATAKIAQAFSDMKTKIVGYLTGIGKGTMSGEAVQAAVNMEYYLGNAATNTTNNWLNCKNNIINALNDPNLGWTASNLANTLTNTLGTNGAAGNISGAFAGAWQSIQQTFSSGFIDGNITSNVTSGMTGAINQLIDRLNESLGDAEGKVNNALANINAAAGNKGKAPRVNFPKIDRLAQGAVIPPNKEFLAILGDQKRGTNIETPLDTMLQAFKMALQEEGSSNKQPIVLQLDGRTVAQVVWSEDEKRYKQTGRARFA